MPSGKIISAKEAEEIKKGYVESQFYSIDVIKDMLSKAPEEDITGIKVSFGSISIQGEQYRTSVLEIIGTDGNVFAAASDPSPCPPDCVTK